MFDNLTVLAVIIIAVWVVTLAYFFYMSRQQTEIRDELEELRKMFERKEREQ
jgi:CcmD family protein